MYILLDWEKDLWKRIFIVVKPPSKAHAFMQVRYTMNRDECQKGYFPLSFRDPEVESTALRFLGGSKAAVKQSLLTNINKEYGVDET
jgi:hypothetical protein